MGRDGGKVHKLAKTKRGQYPAILTEQAWSRSRSATEQSRFLKASNFAQPLCFYFVSLGQLGVFLENFLTTRLYFQ